MGRLKGSPGCCVLAVIALFLALTVVSASAAPEGQLTWGVHVTPAISQAQTLGFPPITGNIVPTSFEFYWQPPVPAYDPGRAKQLWQLGFLNGVSPRVEESGLGLISGHTSSAPCEDLRVRG